METIFKTLVEVIADYRKENELLKASLQSEKNMTDYLYKKVKELEQHE